MCTGPVPSAAESSPAPGSAVWMKDATPPGGDAAAAAAAAQDTDPTPHIPPPTAASFFKGAPMAPTTTDTGGSSSSTPEPSSTAAVPVAAEGILLSDTTTMGEAAGPATTTGSSVSVMTPAASATATTPAEAPAGESDSTEGKGGPDLSKVLPSYEKLPGKCVSVSRAEQINVTVSNRPQYCTVRLLNVALKYLVGWLPAVHNRQGMLRRDCFSWAVGSRVCYHL